MRIGAVAAASGVNVQTLRFYERQGLLPVPRRSPSGYRVYSAETVQVVRFIRHVKTLGFTLAEIDDLLRLRAMPMPNRAKVLSLTTEKIEDIDRRIESLRALRETLANLADSCVCTPARARCPIIETLEKESAVPI